MKENGQKVDFVALHFDLLLILLFKSMAKVEEEGLQVYP